MQLTEFFILILKTFSNYFISYNYFLVDSFRFSAYIPYQLYCTQGLCCMVYRKKSLWSKMPDPTSYFLVLISLDNHIS